MGTTTTESLHLQTARGQRSYVQPAIFKAICRILTKCTGRCFLCRDYLISRTFVKNTLYNTFQYLLLGNMNCKTASVVYLLECKYYHLQYARDSIKNMYTRFSGHNLMGKITINGKKLMLIACYLI